MKYTSAEANKLIKKLNEERIRLLQDSGNKSTFIAAVEENIDEVRPDFNLKESEKQIDLIEGKIRTVKHAINTFNTTNTVAFRGGEITIDEALVMIPMLSEKKRRLSSMAGILERARVESYGGRSVHIEYQYANYSVEEAKAMVDEVTDELSDLQLAIDDANRKNKMEINI